MKARNWPWRALGTSVVSSPSVSVLPIAALLPPPERAEGTVLAVREVLPFFVRAAHVALAHRHGLDAVLLEERLNLLLDFRVCRNVRGDPSHDDRLGTVMQDQPWGDLRGRLVVGAIAALTGAS